VSTAEHSRRWRLAHPEYKRKAKPPTLEQRARRLLMAKRWRKRNKEHLQAYAEANRRRRNEKRRAWYACNKPKDRAHIDRWKLANKDHVNAYNRQYKKRRRVRDAWRKWSGQCAISRQSLGAS
jgi:hypothetical protein